MTFGIPGREAPVSGTPRRTAPTARISLSALALNLCAVLATTRTGLIDVRADAWGHGLAVVARSAIDAGADALLADETDAVDLAKIAGRSRVALEGDSTSPDAVYGLSAGFTPVMSLHGRVLGIKPLRAGEGVSYGYTHRATRDTRLALVTGGYAQGVVRALGNAASVGIAGERHPIVGRVAMDVCVVDIGADHDVPRGAEAVFFGGAPESPDLAGWTAATGMTAAELVTAVGVRNTREYVA